MGTYRETARELRDRHIQCALDLLEPGTYAAAEEELKSLLSHLDDLLYGIFLLRELSDRTRMNSSDWASACPCPFCMGISKTSDSPARLDALEMMKTDDRFGSARLDVEHLAARFREQAGSPPDCSSWKASSEPPKTAPRPHWGAAAATSVPPTWPVSSKPMASKSGPMSTA